MKRQRGVSLSGLLMAIALIVPAALLGMKVVPSVIEYYQILKAVKTVAQDSSVKAGTIMDVRVAYTKQLQVGDFTKVLPNDLEISKDDSGGLLIAFSYQHKIPLFANVSLTIDYEGSSAK